MSVDFWIVPTALIGLTVSVVATTWLRHLVGRPVFDATAESDAQSQSGDSRP